MSRTISIACQRCGYIRYDLSHLTNDCGGLLLKDSAGFVSCRLCGQDMSFNVGVKCGNCGAERKVDLKYLEETHTISVYKMEIFETIVIF